MIQPLFSENFLVPYLADFRLSSIPSVRDSLNWLESFVSELLSGKLDSLKEEEIKSRFVTNFFGDVLGFNYGNSTEWRLREEKKSSIDGTKPDAAVGYFYIDNLKDDVRGIIEVKNAKAKLDEKQARPGERSPVEQAFSYAPKMGGGCKWVIVSNLKEIRFYVANDASRCQTYFIKDLLQETKLKELIFLFHKDRLLAKNNDSPTERLLKKSKFDHQQQPLVVHIVDELYHAVKQFTPLKFIDPEFIASIYPFNISNEYVWHYQDGVLMTLNKKIYDLLKWITIEEGKIVIREALKSELIKEKVVDAERKLLDVFEILYRSRIVKIAALKDIDAFESARKNVIGFSRREFFRFNENEDGVSLSLDLRKSVDCDCIVCNYQAFNFKRVIEKLKAAEGNAVYNTLEYAYANYLLGANDFKNTYIILKEIENQTKGKEGQEIAYFIAKKNLKHLHNLVTNYQHTDRKEILGDIKAIDLDSTVYNELEFSITDTAKRLLLDIKEDRLFKRIENKIYDVLERIEKLKRLYESGGRQHSGPDLVHDITEAYIFLRQYCTANMIIHDAFSDYRSITKRVMVGIVTTHALPEHGISRINSFFIVESILHIRPAENEEIFLPIDVIRADQDCIFEIIERLKNICSSLVSYGIFNDPYENRTLKEYLQTFYFKDKFTDCFANIFFFLSKLPITAEQFFSVKKLFLDFLQCESILSWYDIKYVSNFISVKANFFTQDELNDLLKFSINQHKLFGTKYKDMIKTLARALSTTYPSFEFNSLNSVKIGIIKSTSDNGLRSDFRHLIPLANICDTKCKNELLCCFEQSLDEKFNSDLYSKMLLELDYDFENKNYLQQLADKVGEDRGRAYQYGPSDLVFWNFSNIVYWRSIDFDRPEIVSIEKLNDFESWLLSPFRFEYQKFDAKWLKYLNTKMLETLKTVPDIRPVIERELAGNFDVELARIRYSYFS